MTSEVPVQHTSMPASVRQLLETPCALSDAQIHFFQENGFIKIKDVLPPEVVTYIRQVIGEAVQQLNTQHESLDNRDTYGKAFLQIMNIWRHSGAAKEIVFSKRLAKLAADLLQVDGVRLYHDQALYKEPGGGYTPWHADQYYWPLASDKTVTIWIPLQATPLGMGPLEFSAKSQRLLEGRHLKISDDSEHTIQQKLRLNDFAQVIEPFDLGEVSFHSGWVFHRAGPNKTAKMREVMTMIYMDKDMKLAAPTNDNQQNDWQTWCPGAVIGSIINTPINPVLYEK